MEALSLPRVERELGAVLDIERLALAFAGRKVLDDITLRVGAGDSLAVVGVSGSGKSSMLSCVLGLIRPNSGTIKVDGVVVDPRRGRFMARLRREKLGMIFQGGEMLPALSPFENVVMAALLGGCDAQEARSRASGVLERLKVPDGDRPIVEFSGGEQQRVAVARALVNRPRLLLADEPTSSLDPAARDEVIGLLHSLPEDFGCALVVVTHDPLVASSCRRLARLEDGRLWDSVAQGRAL